MRCVVMPMTLWPGLACVIGRADALSERRYCCSTTPRGVRSGGDEAGLVGDHDELDAVSRAQLGEDAGDVRLDRQGAQVESVCDFAVGASSRDETEHFELARAELV